MNNNSCMQLIPTIKPCTLVLLTIASFFSGNRSGKGGSDMYGSILMGCLQLRMPPNCHIYSVALSTYQLNCHTIQNKCVWSDNLDSMQCRYI